MSGAKSSSQVLYRRSLHIRLGKNPFGGQNLSGQSKDIERLRTHLESNLHFDVSETITEQTYGRDIEGALLEVRTETEARTRKGTDYVVNLIQV